MCSGYLKGPVYSMLLTFVHIGLAMLSGGLLGICFQGRCVNVTYIHIPRVVYVCIHRFC